jgi:2,4-dienoyl-CoA reductase-like NADH-dependent reductase (Old Yellow Enzyme family)
VHRLFDFDLIAVDRQLLQDPEWVTKVKNNRVDEINHLMLPALGFIIDLQLVKLFRHTNGKALQ